MPDSSSAPPRLPPPPEANPGDPLRRSASVAPSNAPGRLLSVALVVLVAGFFFLFRQPLDQHLPRLDRPQVQAPETPTVSIEAPVPQQPAEPQIRVWAFQEMESALAPLPDQTAALIDAGREEIAGFDDLDSEDEARRLRARSQWESWGPIWKNRVRAIREQVPPIDQCNRHVPLEPLCNTLASALQHLALVPLATNSEEALTSLDLAEQVLFPPEEEDGEGEEEPDSEGAGPASGETNEEGQSP